MVMLKRISGLLALMCLMSTFQASEVRIDLKNISGEDKSDWPLILKAYQILGRNLRPEQIDLDKLSVRDSKNNQLAYDYIKLPPYNQAGRDVVVILIPTMKKEESLSIWISTGKSGNKQSIDIVNSPHNLVPVGGFEDRDDFDHHWYGDARLDKDVKRTGKFSVKLSTQKKAELKLQDAINLHKQSRYIFGGWSKTKNVGRSYLFKQSYGTRTAHFSMPGFHNGYAGDLMMPSDIKASKEKIRQRLADAKIANINPQAGTRDWRPLFFWTKGYTDWGVEDGHVTAMADSTEFSIKLHHALKPWMNSKEDAQWWLDDLYLIEQPQVRVCFKEQLQPKISDGIFVFTRPVSAQTGNDRTRWTPYCTYPFAHEEVKVLNAACLRGHEQSFLIGVYHQNGIKALQCRIKDAVLKNKDGDALTANPVEWMPGLLGADASKALRVHNQAIDRSGEGIPYFLLSFPITDQTKPGNYQGTCVITLGDKTVQEIPLQVRVQDLTVPVLKDTYLGWIFQGNHTPHTDEAFKLYQRGGFNSMTIFKGFFKYNKKAKPGERIDLKHLEQSINRIAKYGITSGLCLFTEFDLGPRWEGGRLYKQVKGNKKAWQQEVVRVDTFVKKHPNWPRLIYMTWDEPRVKEKWKKGNHGGVDPRMGWLQEVLPDAPHNVDVSVGVLPHLLKYYSMPTFDDPPEGIGPEVYKYILDSGRDFGVAGAKKGWEISRYHIGMFMATSGARYHHQWHLAFPNRFLFEDGEEVRRTIDFVSSGEGVTDYKVFRLLKQEIEKAKSNPAKKKIAQKAQAYLDEIFKIWDGDHSHVQGVPELGLAYSWGYDQFYDDWREKMLQLSAELAGVDWVE